MNNSYSLDTDSNKPAKEILIISADFPYPTDTGKKVVLSGMLQYFLERFGKDHVTWLLVGLDRDRAQKLSDLSGVRVENVSLPHVIQRLMSLVWYSIICRAKSLQESMFYSPATQLQVEQQIEFSNPDVILFDTIRMGQFLPLRCNQKAILYLDDLFSVRYERMLDQLRQGRSFGSTVLGNFGRFIPGIVRSQINSSKLIQTLLLKYEQSLVTRSERAQPKRFHSSLLLNTEEVDMLKKEVGNANIRLMPPFLGIRDNSKRNYDGKATFVYLGALQYPPNEAGLLEFFDQGLELACRNIPGMELIIVGKGASQRLADAVSKWDGKVRLVGFIEDLSPLFSSSCAVLLPIILGTGVKLKALESMSRGVPIISTHMGVESIPVRHGEDCFIEDDLSKFWFWMDKLTDKDVNLKMSNASFASFERHYSKDAVFAKYDSIFLEFKS